MKRTDLHRPSAINPVEYEYVGIELIPIGKYSGDINLDCDIINSERERIARHMEFTGGTYSNHEHGGNCMVCGSPNAIYTTLFYHGKTNSYVRMGTDCAEKCEMGVDGDINRFKKIFEYERGLQKNKKKVKETLDKANLSDCWDLYNNRNVDMPREEWTIANIIEYFVKKGNLSDKQMSFIIKLNNDIKTREAREIERQEKYEAALEFPKIDERIEFFGTVLNIKYVDSPYGPVKKILVESTDGWKAFGTLPQSISHVERGNKVQFSATFKPSEDDLKFGFFSRPTGAKIL